MHDVWIPKSYNSINFWQILTPVLWYYERQQHEAFKLSPNTSVNQERHFGQIAATSKSIFNAIHNFLNSFYITFLQWMTLLAIIWPCAIFLSTYILRLRFQPHQIESCQFPTRQLPTNDLLPFFQSYICTIESN